MLPFFYCKQNVILVLLNCMKIVRKESIVSLKFIPREAATSFSLLITDKNKRKTYTVNTSDFIGIGSIVNSDGYLSFDLSFAYWEENTNYSLKVVNDSGDVIYRDTIFCTNQTDYDKFDVHKDEYVTEDTYDNEFIVL
jgi:hypothetical protein